MKTQRMLLAAVAAVLVLGASPALATHFEVVEGSADCEGWEVHGSIWFRGSPEIVTGFVDFEVVLAQGGVPVQTHSGQIMVQRIAPANPVNFSLSDMWDGELCGSYTVSGSVVLTTPDYPADDADPRNQAQFTAAFVCDCPPPPPPPGGCSFTPGFWKNHVSDWPTTSLTLGGVTYDQLQLLAILNTPVRGDATIILAYHLIAAKLNVLSGGSDAIQGAIDAADALLSDHPIGSKPSGSARTQALSIKNQLVAYNESGCDDETAGKSFGKDEDEVPVNWGDLKGLYR